VGSFIGLVVYTVIGVNLFQNLTGMAEILNAIPLVVLLALVPIGLVTVIVDTVRIHRADAALRVSALGSVSHYPLYAQRPTPYSLVTAVVPGSPSSVTWTEMAVVSGRGGSPRCTSCWHGRSYESLFMFQA
jgi:hypothetical protein